jgi:hypothetical protein
MSAIQVTQNPDDPTGFTIFATMMIPMERYLGLQAFLARADGIEVKGDVPDCAVMKRKEDGTLYWSWVTATFDIKVEM